jgi:dTMP kinase
METEIFLFSASRVQLVREKIRPYLDQGFYVISDRFHDSTTAYQGYGRGLPIKSVEHINKLAVGDTIPDITFFIDVPVKVAAERKKLKSEADLDRLDNSAENFFEKVREGYLTLAGEENRFRIIDGTKSVGIIHEEVVNEIVIKEEQEKV